MSVKTRKSAKIAAMIEGLEGRDMAAHYLGFFECFNQGLFFEAHDVLEELWLAQGKAGANFSFYKGLIQFAGAFVHLQKDRLDPARRLFLLAQGNLRKYPDVHERFEAGRALGHIAEWIARLETAQANPFPGMPAPVLRLLEGGQPPG